MTFDEVLDQVRELLQRRGRVTYGALKHRFDLEDAYLEDLKGELISAERVAADEDGEVLVWTGAPPVPSSEFQVPRSSQPPVSQTADAGLRTPDAKRQTLDSRLDGERRQLTVEFIDLVGSTTLSQQLDPEDYHARVRAYQAACHQVIQRYDGHIAQYLGDGVLVYFGYPAAHDEDAVRAVRSGLEIVTVVGQLEGTPPLQVRIGIHTGLVVVGEIGAGARTERLALGETPNIAAHMQGQAEPNRVVISAATYQLVQGLFECQDLGPQQVKGLSTPLSLYRVVGESAAQSRFEVAVHKGLTPLVGRAEELALLQQRWEHAKAGAGQVVLLSGVDGRGGGEGCLYCTWEDLHWADPSTLEVLTLFLDQVPTTRLLALLTFRPEFIPPWGNRSHLSQLTLSRLGRSQVEAMVERVTGGKALPPEVVQQIVAKTDGVPLFVEELTKTVVESGLYVGATHASPLPPLAIPATLQDALMARLDRLSASKEIAQLGATIGREFSYELLVAVSPLDEETLQQGLKQLVEAELVYQRGLLPQAHYLFKHALIQDTAYQALLKSTRQQSHRQIAQVLEERFPETVETQPELVAQHYTEAGLIGQAIPYWQQAGEQATQRSAYVEAGAHLTRGLEVLKTLPDTPERTQQELTLQLALHDALMAAKGVTAPDVEKTVLRAQELCQQLGETPQLFPVLWRLWSVYANRGKFQTGHELAEQMMRLAQSVQDQYLLSVAHWTLGVTLLGLGELTSARTHLEQAIALYDPQKHPRLTVGTADPRVNCLSFVSWTLWHLGYPDQALKRSQEAVALAEGLSHPYSLAYALALAAWFHVRCREEQLARERAEAVMALSTEQGFPLWLAHGMMVRGWALAEQGQVEEGIAQMRQSQMSFLAPYVLTEAYGKVGQVEEGLAVLAKALALVDKTGMRVSEAELYRLKGELSLQLKQVETSQDKSEVKTNPEAEAEECFCKAIEIARRQSAKAWELRAVMSLSRLWQTQGKKDEARQLLAEIYGWFTEGFDTRDLQEAKALLEELNH